MVRPRHTNSLGNPGSPIAMRAVSTVPATGLMASLMNRSGMSLLVSSGHDAAVHIPNGARHPACFLRQQKDDRGGNLLRGPYAPDGVEGVKTLKCLMLAPFFAPDPQYFPVLPETPQPVNRRLGKQIISAPIFAPTSYIIAFQDSCNMTRAGKEVFQPLRTESSIIIMDWMITVCEKRPVNKQPTGFGYADALFCSVPRALHMVKNIQGKDHIEGIIRQVGTAADVPG